MPKYILVLFPDGITQDKAQDPHGTVRAYLHAHFPRLAHNAYAGQDAHGRPATVVVASKRSHQRMNSLAVKDRACPYVIQLFPRVIAG